MTKPSGHKRKKYLLPIFLLIMILAVFLYPQPAQATPFSLTGLAAGAAEKIVTSFGNLLLTFFGNILATVSEGFQSFIEWQDFQNVSVVKDSWKLLRDFVNMFFILILVILAFGTIFNVSNYSVSSNPQLIGTFIVTALLINFSLVIGTAIIGFAQVLSKIFISAVENFGVDIAAGLQIQGIVSRGGNLAYSGFAQEMVAGAGELIFSLIVLIILTLSMAAAFIFSVIRVPILWALLIASPAVWVMRILPATRNAWDNYWKLFFSWTFFLPVYLFILTITVSILNTRRVSSINAPQANLMGFASFTFETLFFYILVIFTILWGLKQSLNIGGLASSGAGKMFAKADSWVKTGAKTVAYRWSGIQPRVEGIKQGVSARIERGKQEGIFGLPGQRSFEQKKAQYAQTFGDVGAKERQLNRDVGDYKKELESLSDAQLLERMNKGSLTQKLGAREILRERGQLNPIEMQDTFLMYKNAGADSSAYRFSKGIPYDKLSDDERKAFRLLFSGTSHPGVRDDNALRDLINVMSDKGDLVKGVKDLSEKIKNIEDMAKYFRTDGEKMAVINKSKKYDVIASIEAQKNLGLMTVRDEATGAKIVAPTPEQYNNQVGKEVANYISRAKMDAMIDLSTDIFKSKITPETLPEERRLKELIRKALYNKFKNTESDVFKNFSQIAAAEKVEALETLLAEEGAKIAAETPPSTEAGPGATTASSPIILNLRDKESDII